MIAVAQHISKSSARPWLVIGVGLWVGRGDKGQLPAGAEGSHPDALSPCHETGC